MKNTSLGRLKSSYCTISFCFTSKVSIHLTFPFPLFCCFTSCLLISCYPEFSYCTVPDNSGLLLLRASAWAKVLGQSMSVAIMLGSVVKGSANLASIRQKGGEMTHTFFLPPHLGYLPLLMAGTSFVRF